jgi:pilus assembly protein Flp/PilA
MRHLKPNESYLIETQEQEMKSQIIRFMKDEEGATAIEYGLIAGLISVAIIVAVTAVGTDLSAVFNAISTKLKAVVPAAAPT